MDNKNKKLTAIYISATLLFCLLATVGTFADIQ